jgi:hypothetical protein
VLIECRLLKKKEQQVTGCFQQDDYIREDNVEIQLSMHETGSKTWYFVKTGA